MLTLVASTGPSTPSTENDIIYKTWLKPSMVACACDPSTWEDEAVGSQARGQLVPQTEVSLDNLKRPCLKMWIERRAEDSNLWQRVYLA